MNFEQIMKVLEEKIENVDEFAYGDFGDKKFPKAKYGTPEYKIITIPELGDIEEVDQYGGEGQGETWYSVKHFKDHDVYIKVSGYYASYDGVSFDGWEDCIEVKPQQKTITVYEA